MKKRVLTSKRAIKTYVFILLTSMSVNVWSQVGVGTTNPNASAALEISSTTKGLLLPRMTKSQMEGISNPAEGLLVYCTDCDPKGMYIFNGLTYLASSTGFPSGFDEDMDIVSATGKIWMNKNLGATQVATSSTDHLAYGSLFQWGRSADGHETINWTSSTTTDGTEQARETITLSPSDTPGHDDFITSSGNWRSTPNANLWQGVSGTNNPCPSGYRIPTNAEWNAERLAFATNNAAGAFASLKLPLPGIRLNSNGAMSSNGSLGLYWASDYVNGINLAQRFTITSSSASSGSSSVPAFGMSVRCIKN